MPPAVRRAVAVATLLLMSATLLAQPAPIGETIEVSIVNIDVFVTDKQGNRVRGLTEKDFDVFENGVKQPISNFAEYASSASNDGRVGVDVAAATQAAAPREKRTFLIFLERTQLTNFQATPLFAALKQTVSKTVQPGDGVSVVVWSRHKIDHIEPMNDIAAIHSTLDWLEQESQDAQTDTAQVQLEEAVAIRNFERLAAQMAAGGGKLGSLGNKSNQKPPEQFTGGMEIADGEATDSGVSTTLNMQMALDDMKVRVAAINSAITSIAGLEGKKVLILAPRRLGAVAGAEFAYAGGAKRLSPDLVHRFGTDTLMQSIVDNANASGVTIYPIHLSPTRTAMPDTTFVDAPDAAASPTSMEGAAYLSMQNETTALGHIAAKTGGLMAAGPENVIQLLPRIASDVTDYYSIAYRVTPSGTDRARNVVVKARNPEYTVRSRGQFVERSEPTRMRDRLRAALFGTHLGSPLKITATAGDRKPSGKLFSLPLQIRIPIGALTLLPQGNGKHAGTFSVHVGAAADLDELSDVTQKTQQFEVNEADLERARAGHFTYDLDVEVNEKTKFIAVAVLDEVGRVYGVTRLETVN
jgi:VWFA-related protein